MVKDVKGPLELGNGLTLVDFYATWCGYCKILAPVLDALSQEDAYKDITFLRCDVDEDEGDAMAHGIQALPTLVMFRDGEEIKRQVGSLPEGELRKWLLA